MGNGQTKSLKTLCDMAKLRAQHHKGADANRAQQEERNAVKFLQEDDIENALGKTAWVVKFEHLNKVRDKLVIMLDTLGRKHHKVAKNKTPEDLGIAEIVYTILFLAKELDADRKGDNKKTELQEIAAAFAAYWGKKWAMANENNESGQVSSLIIKYMREADDPTRNVIQSRLQEIADKYGVDYDAKENAEAEQLGGINVWRNEYTVTFESKPFGMEWTATKDGLNLWVSSVDPNGLANVKNVIPGSMIIALNGGDCQNLGAQKIHKKTLDLGLPLRVTFRKPEGLNGPKTKQEFAPNQEVIKKCVELLMNPKTWDFSKQQKEVLCKEQGASAVDISCAMFLADQSIKFTQQQQEMQAQMQQQMNQMNQQMNNMNQQMNNNMNQANNINQMNNNNNNNNNMNQFNNQNQNLNNNMNNNNFNNNMNNNMNDMNNMNNNNNNVGQTLGGNMEMGMPNNDLGQAQVPISTDNNNNNNNNNNIAPAADGGNGDGGMDDLEARFAALRKGLQ